MALADDHLVREKLAAFQPYLEAADVTEVQVNRPGELWTVQQDGRRRHDAPWLTLTLLEEIKAALVYHNSVADRRAMALGLPGGMRAHIIAPPVVFSGFVLMLRKHLPVAKTLDELDAEGAFSAARDVSFTHPDAADIDRRMSSHGPDSLPAVDARLLEYKRQRDWRQFFRVAVRAPKNILVAGSIGSGKTTFARALIGEIDGAERLVTVEDTPEMALPGHPNHVRLHYGSGKGEISAVEALEHCGRLSPDRIILAEIRTGSEAWAYLSSVDVGHPGSISTVHATSALRTPDRLARLIQQSDAGRGMPAEAIRATIYDVIDVIVYMRERCVTEVFFDPIFVRSR